VIGDTVDVIASGPTSHDPTTFADAVDVIRKYQIENEIPSKIRKILQDGADGKHLETLKENDAELALAHNMVIGTNKLALEEARRKAIELGY